MVKATGVKNMAIPSNPAMNRKKNLVSTTAINWLNWTSFNIILRIYFKLAKHFNF